MLRAKTPGPRGKNKRRRSQRRGKEYEDEKQRKEFRHHCGPVQEPGLCVPGQRIYGGLANSWDYGPLGVEFKNNVKKAWLKKFVQENRLNVGLDAAIIMNPQTWVTTGHVAGFSDPLLDCKSCKARHRADKLIGDVHPEVNVDAMSFEEMDALINEHEDVV